MFGKWKIVLRERPTNIQGMTEAVNNLYYGLFWTIVMSITYRPYVYSQPPAAEEKLRKSQNKIWFSPNHVLRVSLRGRISSQNPLVTFLLLGLVQLDSF